MQMGEMVIYPRFRWVVLLMVVLGVIAQSIVMIAPAPLMGEVAKTLGTGVGAATGSVMGTFALAVAITTVIGGILNDRFGLIPMYLVSNLLMLIPTLLMPVYGHTIQAIVVLRILQACGAGPISASLSQVAALWFPPQQRGVVTGLSGLAISLGIAIGMGSAPAVSAVVGDWQSAMAWMSVSIVISTLSVLVVAFGPKPPVVSTPDGNSDVSDSGPFKLACRQPVTWIGVFVIFFSSWILNATNNLLPSYFSVQPPMGVGYGPITAGQLMMSQSIAFMVGSACTGLALALCKGAVNKVSASAYLMITIFTTALVLQAIFSNLTMVFICLVFSGFFQGLIIPAALAFIAMHYPPSIIGKVNGMWMGLGFLGGTLGIFAGAFMLEATGSFFLPILFIGIAAIIGLLVSIFLTPSKTLSFDPKEHTA